MEDVLCSDRSNDAARRTQKQSISSKMRSVQEARSRHAAVVDAQIMPCTVVYFESFCDKEVTFLGRRVSSVKKSPRGHID